MTITGENFSDEEITDNPVRIGRDDCIVQSTSKTEIVCRIEKRPYIKFDNYESEEVPVTVFLKLNDIASCEASSCKFTYNKP